MLEALFSANSGIEANQAMMDVIGNNIANTNTVGFKASETEFESLFYNTLAGGSAPTTTLGGNNPNQVGLGVGVAGVQTSWTQGTSESTGNPLNVSIQGGGFLVLDNAGQSLYTRAGQLQLNANGALVEPDGSFVQGWMADSAGQVDTAGPLTNLTIPTSGSTVPGSATSDVTLSGNVAATNGAGPSVAVTVYNGAGAPSTLTLQFTPPSSGSGSGSGSGGSTWTVAASDGAAASSGTGLAYGTAANVSFSSDGASSQQTLKITDNAGNTYTLNLSGISANALPDSVSASSQNGYAPGTLQSYSIGQSGAITGVFSNGQSSTIGQIALANFANEGGLNAVGDTEYSASASSGIAQIGTPGVGPLGTLAPGTLEASNTDLGQDFTNLIIAQRGYEANANVLSTTNQTLQSLLSVLG